MTIQRSPIAVQVPGTRNTKDGTIRDPWGYLIHTTGGGITAKAKKEKRTPIDVALDVYINSQNGSNGYLWGGPGYVLDHDGTLYQLAPDNVLTNHCGGPNRQRYRNQSWRNIVSATAAQRWDDQWRALGFDDPYDLFPSKTPNRDYVGLEMIPCGDGFGTPMRKGLRFTAAQHDAAVKLGRDLGARHGWPISWARTSRLVGHEDVDIIERDDAKGGWDPGYLRADPYFDFEYVRSELMSMHVVVERG